MEDVKIRKIESLSELESLADVWNNLLGQSISDSFFLTWEWMYSWACNFLKESYQLFILLVLEKEGIIGIAPWYIRPFSFGPFRGSEICFLGSPETGSDYLDVFAKKGKEKDVSSAVYNFLFGTSRAKWDCLRLIDMPAESLFLLHFGTRMQQEGKFFEVTAGSFCPLSRLPGSSEEFLGGLPGKRAQRLRQDIRILQRTDKLEHDISNPNTLEERLEKFFHLYSEKAQRDGEHLRRILTDFINLENSKERVQIDLLKANDIPVAGLLHLIYRNTIYLYLVAVDKAYNPKVSLGNVLVGFCISKAIEQGKNVYDFLKGAEEYKFYWTSTGRASSNLLYYQRGPASVMKAMARLGKNAIKLLTR